MMSKRYVELDSLRGLAALTVVFSHTLLIVPAIWTALANELAHVSPDGNPWWQNLLVFSPLHVVWAGHEAVVFFFVLSGFVLMLPFCGSDSQLPYHVYLIKRVLRLYPPYLGAVLVAFIAREALFYGEVSGVSEWFNQSWQSPLDRRAVLNHVLMIGSFNNCAFNPVLWSLVQEMRISLLFPAIALLVWRWEKVAIGLALFLAPIKEVMIHLKYTRLIAWEHDYFQTVQYVVVFSVGALLAKHRHALAERFLRLDKGFKILLTVAAVMAYTNAFWLTHYAPFKEFPLSRILRREPVCELITAVGVCAFIIVSLSARKLSPFLTLGPIKFLGRISYSLYLYHAVCLKAGVTALYPRLPLCVVLLLCLPASFVVATLSYWLIEIPTMNLGKKITKNYLAAHPSPQPVVAGATWSEVPADRP